MYIFQGLKEDYDEKDENMDILKESDELYLGEKSENSDEADKKEVILKYIFYLSIF